jgi:hypothetical protein
MTVNPPETLGAIARLEGIGSAFDRFAATHKQMTVIWRSGFCPLFGIGYLSKSRSWMHRISPFAYIYDHFEAIVTRLLGVRRVD